FSVPLQLSKTKRTSEARSFPFDSMTKFLCDTNMKILKNIGTLLTMDGAAKKDGRRIKEADLGLQEKAALVFDRGSILWSGPQKKIPREFLKSAKAKHLDAKGMTVLPGLVECHTHLVYAGNRADEFEVKLQGATYQEIAAKGGGILSTMKHTRSASLAKLKSSAVLRIKEFSRQGVTSVEAKSGYGLDIASEIKQLKALEGIRGAHVVRTFLGAHAKPPEFSTHEEYLIYLADKVLPRLAKQKLADRVDIFIEKGFFESSAASVYLKKAKALGFDIVIHADQLSLSGGTSLGLELNAVSCDHLIKIDDSIVRRIAGSDMTAVLLPAADLYMRCDYPPARKLIEGGARVALATDFNPGTSPTQNVQLVGLLARLEMKMSLPEVISAYTVGAAHALKLENHVGSLSPGKKADFVLWDGEWSELFYEASSAKVDTVFYEGLPVYNAKQ
ncbi:MAG: imidazolonepropionase, partial [Bdellovibrionota bacterium]